ncbi:hypothetical protein COV05_01840 [Candidatus Uhrbacteria bacterium CG10_big_fil_rev_8_21_14_0_10_48_16]|uniref:Poly A polymerase head domain-containing protein n=1 Tax=Candidatus Uhrbacteria bacterium CG10_big_fil_rev_8_21_14_0_10_48_16 TaxID=1975038 RepID=A0A2M8LHJ3_9BACT|nr:MAG: hypothetical protein COV05_01840 [Candidatus Uhrbacteria bacterium CG10_big_fil_rev_8_21_14_0_10_48_16]
MESESARIRAQLTSQNALSFIDEFLFAFPNANLYLVGGAIRDALLSRTMHERDYDFVVTHLSPSHLEAWFQTKGELHLVGQHFGVYKFMPTGFTSKDISFIDIALPRTERVAEGSLGGYRDFDVQSDPTLPIETDLARRDFTINAMALDLRHNMLIDPHNGHVDLSHKLLKAVGQPEERFAEDLTRILRGIRFASELGFDIEPETARAMNTLIEEIHRMREVGEKFEYVVPREVIGEEIAKALSRNPVQAVQKLIEHRVIEILFPSVHSILQKNPTYLQPLSQIVPGELPLALTLLFRELSPEQVREAFDFSGLNTLPRGSSYRTEQEQILWLISVLQLSLTPEAIQTMRASLFEKRFFNGKGMMLIRCLEILKEKELAQAVKNRRREIEARWLVDHDESIAPLLSGQDILSQGIPPGPEVRLLLDHVRDLQLDGKLMRREEALRWLKEKQV